MHNQQPQSQPVQNENPYVVAYRYAQAQMQAGYSSEQVLHLLMQGGLPQRDAETIVEQLLNTPGTDPQSLVRYVLTRHQAGESLEDIQCTLVNGGIDSESAAAAVRSARQAHFSELNRIHENKKKLKQSTEKAIEGASVVGFGLVVGVCLIVCFIVLFAVIAAGVMAL